MKKYIALILFSFAFKSYGQDTILINTRYDDETWGKRDTLIKSPAITATSPIFFNNVSGVISSQAASGSQDGYLTSTDWTTFNNKQATLSGTANRITITSNIADISAAYVGQTSITTLGTIGTGIWQGIGIGAVYGGTGQTSVTTGDLLYGSATNTWSKLAAGATSGHVLTSNGSGVAPSWQAAGGGGGTPGGSTTQVQYNLAGAFAADSAFRWARTGQLNTPKNYSGLYLSPAPTAQATDDTLVQATLIRRFNVNGQATTKHYDFKINNNYLAFDSVGNYSINDGGATPHATGDNIMIGRGTGYNSTAMNRSIAIGYRAIYSSATAVKTIAIGYNIQATASGLIAIGEVSGGGALAVNSVNIGNQTGGNAATQANLGYGAGLSNSGANTINIGNTTGYLATGTNTIYTGANTGASATGSYNIFSGFNVGRTGFPYTLTGSSNVLIGNFITAPAAASSNILNIGNVLYGTGLYSSVSTGTQVAQTGGQIGINTQAPATPAALDVTSTIKGVLIPRVTTTERDAIPISTNIISLTLVGGTGYTNGTYTISFSGGGGSGAAGTVVVTAGTYSSWVISNYGTGYTSAPSATISAGAGSGGSITVVLPDLRGLMVYNTTIGRHQYHDGTSWVTLGNRLVPYTVATLPAGTVGDIAYVTDATAPTYNGALTGGGAVVIPVFYNGSAWVSH